MITSLNEWKKFNESNDIVKDDNYYKNKYINDNNLITHPSIKSKEDIKKIVEASEGELNKFLKEEANINYPVTLTLSNEYYKYKTDKIPTGNGVFGLFENVIEYAEFGNFGGGKITTAEYKDEFYFNSLIWFGNLNISYQAISGGSNGMNVSFYKDKNGYPSSTIWFDVLNNKYIIYK